MPINDKTMLTGSMVALVTPMLDDGAVDWTNLDNLIEFHIGSGTQAIVGVGTTGESATLDEAEHCELISYIVDKIAGRVPFIAGTGANSTSEAIRLTKCAEKAGSDAALLVTPYYNKPTQEGLYLHYKAVAEAISISQILYNVPGRTACDLLPETAARLSKIDNIIGIKEATGKITRVNELKNTCDTGFLLLSGDDATCTEFMLAGGDGVISVTANVVPMQMRKMCDAAIKQEQETALALNKPLEDLHKNLFCESNPIPVKWLLADIGLIHDGIRLPLTKLSAKYHETLRESIRQIQA